MIPKGSMDATILDVRRATSPEPMVLQVSLHFKLVSTNPKSVLLDEVSITLPDDFLRIHVVNCEALHGLCESLAYHISQTAPFPAYKCVLGGAPSYYPLLPHESRFIAQFWMNVPQYMGRLRRANVLVVDIPSWHIHGVVTARRHIQQYAMLIGARTEGPVSLDGTFLDNPSLRLWELQEDSVMRDSEDDPLAYLEFPSHFRSFSQHTSTASLSSS